ncbi:MAG: substrate-binding domain-containing protein [Oscillospiraceae bacterium]|nr:substrate-binding domain-containing protein [Oscillospiraceae bacterium]
MKKGIFKRIAVCAVAMSLMASFSACGSKEETTDTISVILKSQDAPQYWDVVANGAKDAGEELGYKIDVQAPPTEADVNVQIDLMNQAIQNGSKAIVLAPLNLDDINPAIQSAQEAGIKLVTIDSRSSMEDLTYIGTDNVAAGSVAGREAKNLLTGSKQVAIIALTPDSSTSIQRAEGFIEALGATGEESEVTIVDTVYCNSDAATAKQLALQLIDKHPDLEMIYGVNQTAAQGICEAIVEKGIPGKVKVVGFDSSDQLIEYLEGGVINGFVVQNPYNMGYLGVRNVAKLLDGESIGSVIDTGATFVTKDNLNDEAVQKLLYPLGKSE